VRVVSCEEMPVMPRTAAIPSRVITTAIHCLTELATASGAPAFWGIRAIPRAKRVPKTAMMMSATATSAIVNRKAPSPDRTDAELGELTAPERL
jgi:hypothetical protein